MKLHLLYRLFRRSGKQNSELNARDVLREIEPYFDPHFYRALNPDIAGSKCTPVEHYVDHGWREGRDPAPWFSTSTYLSTNPDVATSGLNPLYHYARFGRSEGRSIAPSRQTRDKSHDSVSVMAEDFDEVYYLSTYPDIAAGGINPLEHYALFGWKEGRDPCPWFSTTGYLNAHQDVRLQGFNPFYHYIKYGRAERRRTVPARYPIELKVDPGVPAVTLPALQELLSYPERETKVDDKSYDAQCLNIHWVIPDFAAGGGGHMTIFRMVRWLEFFGHRCSIWIHHDCIHAGGEGAYDEIVKHFQPVRAEVRVLTSALFEEIGDAIFATSWETVWPVMHCTGFKEKFYLVQDYEPLFHARGAHAIAASLTYTRDIACICAGPWLQQLMEKRHARWARSFWLAYNPEVYFLGPRPRANSLARIAVYNRAHTPRRLVELALLALSELTTRGVKFHADLFGDDFCPSAFPFPATNHGILNEENLAKLYNSADIGICFSGTNYSLVPNEMMACGLPVLEFDNESTRAIYPDNVVTFAGPEPSAIADSLERLIKSPELRAKQSSAALNWVRSFSWEKSARDTESAIKERIAQKGWQLRSTQKSRDRIPGESSTVNANIKVSIVIPTLNPGEGFKELLRRLRTQRLPWNYEIVIIDSSSTDGSAEFCRAQPDIVFAQIPRELFNHGRTRNQAISMCQGEYVALLTQDAHPIDEFWLYNFIILLEHYPNAAGVFGKHLAWPGASPFVRRELEQHFARFDRGPISVNQNSNRELWKAGDSGWRQFLFFYSDNNSCLRRRVWEKLPYPEIDYGEDQLWARAIIDAGFDKLYSPKSIVFHSHDYTYEEALERAAIEAKYFLKYFGVKVLNEDPVQAAKKLNLFESAWARSEGISTEEIQKRLQLNEARMIGYAKGLNDNLRI